MMSQTDTGNNRTKQKPQYNYKIPRVVLAFWGSLVLLALTTVGLMVAGHLLDQEGHHTIATILFVGGCFSFGGACVAIVAWITAGD